MEFLEALSTLLLTLSFTQLLSGAVGILLVIFSLVGYAKLVLIGTEISAEERAKQDAEADAYFKRYKVRPPR